MPGCRTGLACALLFAILLSAQIPAGSSRPGAGDRKLQQHMRLHSYSSSHNPAPSGLATPVQSTSLPIPSSTDSTSRHAQARRLTSTAAPIRIFLEYQLPQDVDSSLQTTLQSVVTAAVLSLQQYIKVKVPVGSSGLLAVPTFVNAGLCDYVLSAGDPSSTCSGPGFFPSFTPGLPSSDIRAPLCGPARINPEHVLSESCSHLTGPGPSVTWGSSCRLNAAGSSSLVQADLFLYITSDQSYCQAASPLPDAQGAGGPSTHPGTSSQACMLDTRTSRPVLGMLNLCPALLQQLRNSSGAAAVRDRLLAAVLHELLHVLGFNNALFQFFISPVTGRRLGAEAVVKQVPAGLGQARGDFSMLVTPTVVREARAQLGCASLAGAALEDQGGTGVVNNHWEGELFQGELMAAGLPPDAAPPRLSRLTLALMEDTGWYQGVWGGAAYLDWGRGAGCAMAQNTCAAYAAAGGQPYFCTPSSSSPNSSSMDTCTFNSLTRGQCSNSAFSSCSIVTAPASPAQAGPSCTAPGSSNLPDPTADAQGAAAFHWATGSSARCMQAQLPLTSFPASSPALTLTSQSLSTQSPSIGLCWNTSCTGGVVTIDIGNASGLVCPSGPSGQQLQLSPGQHGVNGTLNCPDAALVCRTLDCPSAGCSSTGGDCFEGACVCRLGSAGADCSLSLWNTPLPTMKFTSQQSGQASSPLVTAAPAPPPGSPAVASSGGTNAATEVAAPTQRPQTLSNSSSAGDQGSDSDAFKKYFPILVIASVVGCVFVGAAVFLVLRRADARWAQELEMRRMQQ